MNLTTNNVNHFERDKHTNQLVVVPRTVIGNDREVVAVVRNAMNRGTFHSIGKPKRLSDGQMRVVVSFLEEQAPGEPPAERRDWPLTAMQTAVVAAVLAGVALLAFVTWMAVRAVSAAASWAGGHGQQIGAGLFVLAVLVIFASIGGGRGGGTFTGTFKGTWR